MITDTTTTSAAGEEEHVRDKHNNRGDKTK